MNSEIRTLHFAQGVDVDSAIAIEETGDIDLANNTASQDLDLSYDLAEFREIIFTYSVRRRTDSTTGLIERGQIRLTADPDGAGALKWILSTESKNDEGTTPGVTFSKSVTGNVVDLLASTSNIAGANHHCYVNWNLKKFLV